MRFTVERSVNKV